MNQCKRNGAQEKCVKIQKEELTKIIPVGARALPVIVAGRIIGHEVRIRRLFKCFFGLHMLRKSLRVQVC
jgi:hypothetical protein